MFAGVALLRARGAAPLPAIALGIFSSYIAVQGLTLPYPERSLIGAAYPALAALVLWATAALGESSSVRLWLLRATVAGAFLLALTGFIEYFEVHLPIGTFIADRPPGYGMVGVIGQRNMFAAYVACGICALLALRSHWAIALLAGLPMVMAEAYTGARVSWLFMMAAGLAVRDRRAMGLWVALLAAFAVVRLGPAADVVIREASTVVGSAQQAAGSRWTLIVSAWRIWLDHPLFGAGVGEFALQSYLHLTPGDAPVIERHAHNVVMQLLAETGLVGAGILFAAAMTWARRVRWRELAHDAGARGCVAVLGIIGIYSFTEFPLWHMQFTVLTAALMGATMERHS